MIIIGVTKINFKIWDKIFKKKFKILQFFLNFWNFHPKFWQEEVLKFLPAAPPKIFLGGFPFWNFQRGLAFKPPPLPPLCSCMGWPPWPPVFYSLWFSFKSDLSKSLPVPPIIFVSSSLENEYKRQQTGRTFSLQVFLLFWKERGNLCTVSLNFHYLCVKSIQERGSTTMSKFFSLSVALLYCHFIVSTKTFEDLTKVLKLSHLKVV